MKFNREKLIGKEVYCCINFRCKKVKIVGLTKKGGYIVARKNQTIGLNKYIEVYKSLEDYTDGIYIGITEEDRTYYNNLQEKMDRLKNC